MVLDGLEAPDGNAELRALLGVLHREVEHAAGETDELGGGPSAPRSNAA